jgi:hypothetical protein
MGSQATARAIRGGRRQSRRARYLRLMLDVVAVAVLGVLSLLIACQTTGFRNPF